MSLYYIHPVLPSRTFGPVEVDQSFLIAELKLVQGRPQLQVFSSSYKPLLSPLTEDEQLTADEKSWEKALSRFGLALVKQ